MHRNRAERGERRQFKINVLWKRCQKIARHHVVFGMDGKAAAHARYTLANLKACMFFPSATIVPEEEYPSAIG